MHESFTRRPPELRQPSRREHIKTVSCVFCVTQAEGLVEQTRGKPVLVLKAGVRLAIALWAILVIKLCV